MTEDNERSCEERIELYLSLTANHITIFMNDPKTRNEGNKDISSMALYFNSGPDFYADPDPSKSYYEMLMMGGGPSDMFRFHADGTIEYRFHDWYDGAGRDVTDAGWAIWLRSVHGPLDFEKSQEEWSERQRAYELEQWQPEGGGR